MPLKTENEEELAIELRSQIRAFNNRAIKYFALMVGLLILEIYFLGVVLKLGLVVHVFAFPTGGFFLYKLISGLAKALNCPRCGKPYNWNPRWHTAIPFSRKCQNCGLPLHPR